VGGVDEEISAHQVPNALLLGVSKLYVNIITISKLELVQDVISVMAAYCDL